MQATINPVSQNQLRRLAAAALRQAQREVVEPVAALDLANRYAQDALDVRDARLRIRLVNVLMSD